MAGDIFIDELLSMLLIDAAMYSNLRLDIREYTLQSVVRVGYHSVVVIVEGP